MKNNKKIVVTHSVRNGSKNSVLEMEVAPETGNPKHFHTLFCEIFEVIQGELFIGSDRQTQTLNKGEKIKVKMGETHFFKNKTNEVCRIRVTLNPGNRDFEDAMLIYDGLRNDGLLTKSGTPKKLYDLAIFIKLNNSKMKGSAKILELLLNLIANRAIISRRLEELKEKYCNVG